ncbi:HNH endonuclease signature motif containing protein [Bosea sp. Root670]|uniref:HNH endonuclease signature motif containing protein n=1 Tax=Bosea sp. Root670 TaxID=1736583 RepID=UPI0039B72C69
MQRGAYGKQYWASRRYCSWACHAKARNSDREALFWQRVRKSRTADGCWLWAGLLDKDGYGRVTYFGVTGRAHRKAYELVCGAIPDGMLLRHSCDNPRCVNPRHLTVGTVADNSADMVERGRAVVRIGNLNTAAKLSESQARSIFTDTRHHREIASEYGVSSETVWDIKSGRSWSHLRLRGERR